MRARLKGRHWLLALAGLSAGDRAWAANGDSFTLSASNPMDIGRIAAAATGVTTFQVTAQSGLVTLTGGSGRRLSSGSARVTVTVSCQKTGNGNGNNPNNCNSGIDVVIGSSGTPNGRTRAMSAFTVAMGTAVLNGAVTGTDPITFTLEPIGDNQSRTFYVGASLPIGGDDGGGATGYGASPYTITIKNRVGHALDSVVTSGAATVDRAMAISQTADLRFGSVSRPVQGAGSATINPTTGARSTSGGAAAIAGPAFGPASFSITGEGGQSFSASVPATISLTGPANLDIQTTTNLPVSPTLSGSIGQQGSFTLKVGGVLPVTNTSALGAYSGTWMVTVDYN